MTRRSTVRAGVFFDHRSGDDQFATQILPVVSYRFTTDHDLGVLGTLETVRRHGYLAPLEVLQLDFIRTARTKGLTERDVRWRHAWRNALGSVLTLFGLWLPLLLAGSVFVESVFAWPGLGTLAADAIGTRDYPVIMGTSVLVAATVVLGNLIADLMHRWLAPRLRTA